MYWGVGPRGAELEKCVEELIQNGLPDAMRSDKASRLCNPCHDDKNGEGGSDLQPKSKNFTVFLCSNVADSIKSLNISLMKAISMRRI